METPSQAGSLQEFWKNQVDAWKDSGLSGAKFCKAHQLIYHRFVYWRQKFAEECSQPATSDSAGGFVAVSCSPVNEMGLSVSLPSGLVIRGIHAGNLSVVRHLLDTFR
jgi:hypothetical protein